MTLGFAFGDTIKLSPFHLNVVKMRPDAPIEVWDDDQCLWLRRSVWRTLQVGKRNRILIRSGGAVVCPSFNDQLAKMRVGRPIARAPCLEEYYSL